MFTSFGYIYNTENSPFLMEFYFTRPCIDGAAAKGTHPIRASESQCLNKFDDLRLELESILITLLLS
jgi:hypothetical protein